MNNLNKIMDILSGQDIRKQQQIQERKMVRKSTIDIIAKVIIDQQNYLYDAEKAIKQCDLFFKKVMPNINMNSSSLSAKQIGIWNDTESMISDYIRKIEKEHSELLKGHNELVNEENKEK